MYSLQGERLLGTPQVSLVFSGLLMTTAPVTQQLRLLTIVVYSSASNFLLESGTSCHPSPLILLFKAPLIPQIDPSDPFHPAHPFPFSQQLARVGVGLDAGSGSPPSESPH
jgi:hypothetical protein